MATLDAQAPGPDNIQQNEALQNEADLNLRTRAPEPETQQREHGGEQQDDAAAASRAQAPEPAADERENEGEEEEWEDVGRNAEEDSSDSDSRGDSSTSSEYASSDETPKATADAEPVVEEKLLYGCSHYRRKCKIVAPCCDTIFWCRHCHNEATENDLAKAHEIDRHAVEEVVCAACETRQPVSNKCTSCGITFGNYFCSICKFWDDQGEKKKVYHCAECEICRLGGRENYFHCPTCGSCYPLQLQNKHKCLENAMRRQCPVCLEDMFSSLRQSQVLLCGHTLHSDCLRLLQRQRGLQAIRCPMCSKSIADYSEYWKQLSEEIELLPLEDQFKRKVRIVCNDCLERSSTDFHFIGLKCMKCNSFNTRDIAEE